MLISTRARAADVRALMGAIVLGSTAGLVTGAAYLAGSGLHGASHAPLALSTAAASARLGQTVALRSATAPPATTAVPTPVAVASAPRSGGFAGLLRSRFHLDQPLNPVAARPFRVAAVAAGTSDQTCLAEVVYFEARGEPEAGQQAVAQVVLNRVRHPAFPKTVCGVVHQRSASNCQFAFACTTERPATATTAWRHAQGVASAALHGAVMAAVGDATHFQTARGGPFAGLLKVAQIGAHVFYRFGGHAGAPSMFHQTPAPSSAPPARIEEARASDAAPAAPRVELARLDAPSGPGAGPVLKADAIPVRIDAAHPFLPKPSAVPAARSVATAAAAPADAKAPDHAVPAAAPVKAPADKPAVTVALAS